MKTEDQWDRESPLNMTFATRSKACRSFRSRRKVPRYAKRGRSFAVGSWASMKSCESVMFKAVAICTNVSTCGMRCARSIIERYEAAVTHYHLDVVRTRFRPACSRLFLAVSDPVPRPHGTLTAQRVVKAKERPMT